MKSTCFTSETFWFCIQPYSHIPETAAWGSLFHVVFPLALINLHTKHTWQRATSFSSLPHLRYSTNIPSNTVFSSTGHSLVLCSLLESFLRRSKFLLFAQGPAHSETSYGFLSLPQFRLCVLKSRFLSFPSLEKTERKSEIRLHVPGHSQLSWFHGSVWSHSYMLKWTQSSGTLSQWYPSSAPLKFYSHHCLSTVPITTRVSFACKATERKISGMGRGRDNRMFPILCKSYDIGQTYNQWHVSVVEQRREHCW